MAYEIDDLVFRQATTYNESNSGVTWVFGVYKIHSTEATYDELIHSDTYQNIDYSSAVENFTATCMMIYRLYKIGQLRQAEHYAHIEADMIKKIASYVERLYPNNSEGYLLAVAYDVYSRYIPLYENSSYDT